jgi:hypothetical protein
MDTPSDDAIAIGPEVTARIEELAVPFVERLISATPGSPAFHRALRAIDSLGDREIRTTTEIARAFRDSPARALRDVLADGAPLTRNLRSLRQAAERLGRENNGRASPNAERDASRDLARAEGRIRTLVEALDADRRTLAGDNAAIAQQELALWTQIQTLREYATLAARLDELLEARIEEIAAADTARGRTLREEAQYAVRRRRRDLLLQLAVATQGYAALRLIEQDNLEVIWAIRAATTTTVTALRTALLAAGAVADHRLSDRLDLVGLGAAWVDVLGAVDEVDARKRKALAELAVRTGPAGRAAAR